MKQTVKAWALMRDDGTFEMDWERPGVRLYDTRSYARWKRASYHLEKPKVVRVKVTVETDG